MNKWLMICSGSCALLYAIDVYLGQMVPAWAALVWCLATFVRDADAYFEEKRERK